MIHAERLKDAVKEGLLTRAAEATRATATAGSWRFPLELLHLLPIPGAAADELKKLLLLLLPAVGVVTHAPSCTCHSRVGRNDPGHRRTPRSRPGTPQNH